MSTNGQFFLCVQIQRSIHLIYTRICSNTTTKIDRTDNNGQTKQICLYRREKTRDTPCKYGDNKFEYRRIASDVHYAWVWYALEHSTVRLCCHAPRYEQIAPAAEPNAHYTDFGSISRLPWMTFLSIAEFIPDVGLIIIGHFIRGTLYYAHTSKTIRLWLWHLCMLMSIVLHNSVDSAICVISMQVNTRLTFWTHYSLSVLSPSMQACHTHTDTTHTSIWLTRHMLIDQQNTRTRNIVCFCPSLSYVIAFLSLSLSFALFLLLSSLLLN